jgi:hypothetical protein
MFADVVGALQRYFLRLLYFKAQAQFMPLWSLDFMLTIIDRFVIF